LADPKRKAGVALVGGETLAGREVRDVLASAGLPARVKLIGAGEGDGLVLTVEGGEPVVVSALDEENLVGAGVVILAGSSASSRAAYALLAKRSPRPGVIDLTAELESLPEARLRAPVVEGREGGAGPAAVEVIAHPAAIAVALLLGRLAVRHAVIQVLAPVSELGQRGVDGLQQQVVNLLTFKPLSKTVFDEQIGFNLLARYGAEAPQALASTEARIDRHLAALLAGRGHPVRPSLRLVQAPVFHGYSFSAWLEMEGSADPREIAEALVSSDIDVRTGDDAAPSNVAVAGQGGIVVGAIESDRRHRQAVWLWAVADNLRLAADNAVAVLGQLLEARA
jgi:aspartate-semialdehyde dehydrogenase